MRTILLAASFLATPFAVSAALADEYGQQFFFRYPVAGISSTDGNAWEDIAWEDIENPGGEEPEEPEEPEEEPYILGALNWTPEIINDYVEGVYFNKQLRTWFPPSSTISGQNGMTIECVGCAGNIELFTRHIILPDDRPDDSSFGLINPYERAPAYISMSLNDVYRIGAMSWSDLRGPISIYRNGEFVMHLSPGESSTSAIGDEIRWYYPEDGSSPITFNGGVPLHKLRGLTDGNL